LIDAASVNAPIPVPEPPPPPEIDAMALEHPDGMEGMEIEGEEDDNHPTPIAVWSELIEQDGSVGIDSDLMDKIRKCENPDDNGDASRRVPGRFNNCLFGCVPDFDRLYCLQLYLYRMKMQMTSLICTKTSHSITYTRTSSSTISQSSKGTLFWVCGHK
jgi:hypothetical protein